MMYMECQISDNVRVNDNNSITNSNNNNSIISMNSEIPENNNNIQINDSNNNVEMEILIVNTETNDCTTTITTTTSPVNNNNNNNEDGIISSENSDTIFNELDPNKYFNENTFNEQQLQQQNIANTTTTTTTTTTNSLGSNNLENSETGNGEDNENTNSSSSEAYVKGDSKYVYLLDGKKLENLRIKELQDELKKRNVTPKSRFVKSQLIEKLIHLLKREKQGKSNFSIMLASDWALSYNTFSNSEKNELSTSTSSSAITSFQNQMLTQDPVIASPSLVQSQNNTYNALVSGKPGKADKKKKKKSKDKKQKTDFVVKSEVVANNNDSNKHAFVTQILVQGQQTPQQQQAQITPQQPNPMSFHHSHSSFIQQQPPPPLFQAQMYQNGINNGGYYNNGPNLNLFHSDSCVPLISQQNNLILQQQQIQMQQPIQYQVPSQIQYQNSDIPFNYLNDFSQNPQQAQQQHLLSQSQPQLQTHQQQHVQQVQQQQQQQQYCNNVNGVQQTFSSNQQEFTNSFDFFNQNGIQAITSHQSTPQPYFQSPIIQPTQISQSQPTQQTIHPVVQQIPNQPPNSPSSSSSQSAPLQQVVPNLTFPNSVTKYQPPPLPVDEKESYILSLKSRITELESQIESLKSNQPSIPIPTETIATTTTTISTEYEIESTLTSDTDIDTDTNEFKLTSAIEKEISDKIQIDFKSNLSTISKRLLNKYKKDFVNFMVFKIIQQQSDIDDYSVFKLTAPPIVQDYIDELSSFSPSVFKEFCDSIKIQFDQSKDEFELDTNNNEEIDDTKVENSVDIDIGIGNLESTTTTTTSTTKDEFSVTYEYQKKYHYDDDTTSNNNNNNNNELKRIKYF